MKKNDNNLRDLCDHFKCPSILIIGVPEEEDKNKGVGAGEIRERGPVRKLLSKQGRQEEVSANLDNGKGTGRHGGKVQFSGQGTTT